MKAIVIYETKYGYTKEVAEFINHEVAEAEIISIDDVASINIKKYDKIFVCGNINYGEVSQKTTAFLKKNKSTLMYKNIKLFCSALDPIDFTKAVQISIDPDLFYHLKVYNAGGRLVWSDLTFKEKRKIKKRLKIKSDVENFDMNEIKKFITL